MAQIASGLSGNVQLGMAIVAGVAAIGLILGAPDIHDGTGTVIATLSAGAGWLIRDLLLTQRRRRSFCQAYQTASAQLLSDLDAALSDEELRRFAALREGIAAGTVEPTVAVGDINPLPLLPDINDFGDTLGAEAVGAVWAWRAASTDLIQAYKLLGTRGLAEIGEARYADFMVWIATSRDAYAGVCTRLAGAMKQEMG